MEKTEFKKVFGTCLKDYNFEYKDNAYYFNSKSFITVISLQKSNYDNSYYINYGFLIKELNQDVKYPKDNVCDIRGRFGFRNYPKKYLRLLNRSKVIYNINLEEIDSNRLESLLRENMKKIILPVLDEGLEKYFEMFPGSVASITLKGRTYMSSQKIKSDRK